MITGGTAQIFVNGVLYTGQALADGTYTVTATITDGAGNVHPNVTAPKPLVIDTTVAAPGVVAPASVDATTDSTFTVTITGEAGAAASWTITEGVTTLSGALTLDASGNGSFTADVSGFADGTLTTAVTLTDLAGNHSAAGNATTTKNTAGAGVGVTAVATDSTGSEQGQDPLTFVVSRSGSTASSLTVTLDWSTGSATYGTDYTVTVAGGSISANGTTLMINRARPTRS